MNDSGVAVRPHRDGIALVFHPVIWIFMPRDGEAAGPPLKPTVAYPHPAYPITAAPRKMHKKGLKLIRNLSRRRMHRVSVSGPTWLTRLQCVHVRCDRGRVAF